jgi:hypothetical protein
MGFTTAAMEQVAHFDKGALLTFGTVKAVRTASASSLDEKANPE